MSGASEKPDARGGKFFLLPHCLAMSEAWRTASPRAVKALFVLWGRHSGFNNGKISMSLDELAKGMDSQFHKGNARAMAELHARGIAVVERSYPKSSRLSPEYRLTFLPTAKGPATHDYLKWQAGDLGTRKKPVVITARDKAVSTAVSATDVKVSTVVTATEEKPNDGKLPFSPSASVAVSAGHIGNHPRVIGEASPAVSKTAGGPHLVHSRIATAAPSPEELRARVAAHVAKYGHGSQGRLAHAAGIPVGTFSKFLNNDGPLSAHARVQLTCAFPKTQEAERLTRPMMARA